MALTLNTNIDSVVAQNNLTGSQALLAQSLTRLSSGLRINTAADDAAGLAISQQFTTQINGTNQAINNANDAVSEAQTAGGALSTIVNNLQSIRTLAVESANGSNSSSDRAALDQQVQQQIAEITQIASQTTFNGQNVLNGTSGVTQFQVGANVGDTISIDLSQGVGANQIGQVATSTGNDVTTTALTTANPLTIQVGTNTAVTIGASQQGSANLTNTQAGESASSAYAKVAAINAAGVAGLTASAATSGTGGITAVANASATTAGTYDLSINGTSIYSGTGNVAASGGITTSAIATQINLYSATTGVTASLSGGNITLAAADGRDINLSQTVTGLTGGLTAGAAPDLVGAAVAGVSTGQITGQITLSAANNITVGGSGAADIGFSAGTISLGAGTLANQNVLTVAGANNTIAAVDSALATVSAFQSQLGAIQNRFTAAVSNLTSTSQNLTQSRSTIQDANFAQETANLTQAQVLEQAGISVLAQANQQPQLILKLLQ
jgi:flagellin